MFISAFISLQVITGMNEVLHAERTVDQDLDMLKEASTRSQPPPDLFESDRPRDAGYRHS